MGDVSDAEFATVKLELNNPAGQDAKGGAHLWDIKHLQLQGGFHPTNKIDFEITSITAIPAEK